MGALSFCGNCCGGGKLSFADPEGKKPFDWKKLPEGGEEPFEVKFLCVGDSQVGKSTLLQSYQANHFVESVDGSKDLSIEVTFEERKVKIEGVELASGDEGKDDRVTKYKDM